MMKKTTIGIIGISLVAILAILVVTLPVSGENGALPQNGTGNQYGGQMLQNGAGQAMQQAGNMNRTCIREDCPNNGTPKRDGTGQKLGQSGRGSGNGGQSGHHGQGSGQECGSRFQR